MSPSAPQNADGEVALDIEVAAAVAPKAKIVVYFAPNTPQGFFDVINHAVHDSDHNPSVNLHELGLCRRTHRPHDETD